MGDTSISWTDKTWNPIRGCSRVSEGCRFIAEHLADPLRWKKPQRVFVNSMSDLFHEKLTNEQIAAVFGVMAASPQHTFQVLTKRAKRMRQWFEWAGTENLDSLRIYAQRALDQTFTKRYVDRGRTWPLPNVWLGVSVENQDAMPRVVELLRTPAAIHFVFAEPLLGPLDFAAASPNARSLLEDLDWLIAGCESGKRARRCFAEWLRSVRDQCRAARTAFFLKQAEESVDLGEDRLLDIGDDDTIAFGDGSKLKGQRGRDGCRVVELPYLDGEQHAAFPAGRP